MREGGRGRKEEEEGGRRREEKENMMSILRVSERSQCPLDWAAAKQASHDGGAGAWHAACGHML